MTTPTTGPAETIGERMYDIGDERIGATYTDDPRSHDRIEQDRQREQEELASLRTQLRSLDARLRRGEEAERLLRARADAATRAFIASAEYLRTNEAEASNTMHTARHALNQADKEIGRWVEAHPEEQKA